MTDKATHTPANCPLCNSDSHLIPHSLINTIRYYVQCEHCGLRTATSATPEESLTAWNTRAVNSHHDLIEALRAFAFVGEDDPKDTQAVWEMIYRDRVQDWFSYEDFEAARAILTKAEAGHG